MFGKKMSLQTYFLEPSCLRRLFIYLKIIMTHVLPAIYLIIGSSKKTDTASFIKIDTFLKPYSSFELETLKRISVFGENAFKHCALFAYCTYIIDSHSSCDQFICQFQLLFWMNCSFTENYKKTILYPLHCPTSYLCTGCEAISTGFMLRFEKPKGCFVFVTFYRNILNTICLHIYLITLFSLTI